MSSVKLFFASALLAVVAFQVGIFVGSRQESGVVDLALYGGKNNVSTMPPETSSPCRTDVPSKKVKNVVIAMAVGTYTIDPFKIFVGSLRRYYSGDVVLIVGPVKNIRGVDEKAEILEYLKVHNVTLVKRPSTEMPAQERYIHYEELCRHPYTHCLLADFRDTFFQSDPFIGAAEGPDVRLSEECAVKIGDEHINGFNAMWIRDCYGGAALDRCRQRPILCSGLFLLTVKAAGLVMKLMNEGLKNSCCKHQSLCDQGIFEYLWYNGSIPLLLQKEGVSVAIDACLAPRTVLQTVGFLERVQLKDGTGNGPVLLQDRKVAPVVHQYDRMGYLIEYTRRSFL